MNTYNPSSPFSSAQPFSSALYDSSSTGPSSTLSPHPANGHNTPTSASPVPSFTSQTKSRLLPPHIGTSGLMSPGTTSLPPSYPLSAGPSVGNEFRSLAAELDRERAQSARLAAVLEVEREKSNQFRNALRRQQTESAQMNDAYASFQQVADLLRRRCATLESELAAARDAVHMASREAAREQELRVRFENELEHCRRAVRDAAQRAIEVLVFAADGDQETQQVARDVALWRAQGRDMRTSGLGSTLVPVTHIKTVLSKLEEYAKQWRNDRTLFLRTKLHQQQQQAIAASIAASNINSITGNLSSSGINGTSGDPKWDASDRRYSTNTSASSTTSSVNPSNMSMTRSITPFGSLSEDGPTSSGASSSTGDLTMISQEGFVDTDGRNATLALQNGVNGIIACDSNRMARKENKENKSNGSLKVALGTTTTSIINAAHSTSLLFDVVESPVSAAFPSGTPTTPSAPSMKTRSDSTGSTITLASFWPSNWQSNASINPPPGLGSREASKWSEIVKNGEIKKK